MESIFFPRFDPQCQGFILICAMFLLTLLIGIGSRARNSRIKRASFFATLPIGAFAFLMLRTFAML